MNKTALVSTIFPATPAKDAAAVLPQEHGASAVSWLLGFKECLPVIFIVIALYGIYVGCSKLERFTNEFRRRQELDRMPVFSVQGNILRMVDKKAGAQERIVDELSRVRIITTDQGPFVCDSFLNLAFQDGTEWLVPRENPDYQNFYNMLGKLLPLDDKQAFLAALLTGNIIFTLWDREKPA